MVVGGPFESKVLAH